MVPKTILNSSWLALLLEVFFFNFLTILIISRLYCIDRFAYKIVRNRRETLAALRKEKAQNQKENEDEDDHSQTGFRDLLSLYIDKGK